jgi:hypothetical protein
MQQKTGLEYLLHDYDREGWDAPAWMVPVMAVGGLKTEILGDAKRHSVDTQDNRVAAH